MSLYMKVKFQSQNVTLENYKKKSYISNIAWNNRIPFKYPWDIFHSIQDYIRKKKPYNFQYYTIIIMLDIKWLVTTYNNKKKIVVNLKKLIWPKNKKIKLWQGSHPKKKKRGTQFFCVWSIFLHLASCETLCFDQISAAWCLYRWWIGCWLWWWGVEWVDLVLQSFGFSLIAWSPSNSSTTSFMAGRFLGSDSRHFRVSCTASNAASVGYWPSIRISIMLFNFLLLERDGLSHSTRFCCPLRLFASTARLPVSI